MRAAALVLLVALIGPSVTALICDLTCVTQQHHAAGAASAAGCHEQSSSTAGPAVTNGNGALCHDKAETVTARLADPQPLNGAPAVVQLDTLIPAHEPTGSVEVHRRAVSPPHIVLVTTQLRI
jgi:hypothetical protein